MMSPHYAAGPMGAFSRAMLDQLADLNRDVRFEFSLQGGPAISCLCRDFIAVRPEEEKLIRECLAGTDKPRILDVGCGIGRHGALVRRLSPGAEISLVESDPDLLGHACAAVAGSVGYALLEDLPDDATFDCITLLGNGLGIFGTEQATREGIRRIRGLMAEGGSVLIESGNFARGDFYEAPHQLRYKGLTDTFTWGYATRKWVDSVLASAGFVVESITASTQGGPFFIVHAKQRSHA